MKTSIKIFTIFIASVLVTAGCGLINIVNARTITPSKVIISENREVSGFDAIEFSLFGKVNIIQGDQESLNLSGPDNVVPVISTSVMNGKLIIKTTETINIDTNAMNSENMLTFTIVVKDLTSLAVSGAGDVQIETLSTPSMDLKLSGAGKITQNQITTDKLNITISGVGGIDISGQATETTVEISGAGGVNAPDLKIQNANITISGLGDATVWVTDQLTGNISGAGDISYYGDPQIDTEKSGMGNFTSLGNK